MAVQTVCPSLMIRSNDLKTEFVVAYAHDQGGRFKVLVDPQKVGIGEPDIVAEIGWFTFDKLPEPIHSAVPHTLELRRQHFY